MSSTGPEPPLDGPDILAGEFVLGVLNAADHAAAARRLGADPAFAAEVTAWEARLTPLFGQVAAVEPPERLWPAISARLGGSVVAFKPRPRAWDNPALWRGLTAASLALAAASLVLVILPRTPAPVPTPPVAPATPPAVVAIARLDAPKGGAAFVATLDEARHQLIVTPVAGSTTTGKSPELWLMPDKTPPVSLGVFKGQQTLVVDVPAGLTGDSLLGVSLEPLGGSPSGAPTGPVIAVGKLMRL